MYILNQILWTLRIPEDWVSQKTYLCNSPSTVSIPNLQGEQTTKKKSSLISCRYNDVSQDDVYVLNHYQVDVKSSMH